MSATMTACGSLSKVMVVDDEPAVRKLVAAVLRTSGYAVVDAGSPQQAIDLLDRNEDIELLLTDVTMPSETGCELAARMRTRRPNLRVMFMSGYTMDMTALATVTGALFLCKPFRINELLSLVRQALA